MRAPPPPFPHRKEIRHLQHDSCIECISTERGRPQEAICCHFRCVLASLHSLRACHVSSTPVMRPPAAGDSTGAIARDPTTSIKRVRPALQTWTGEFGRHSRGGMRATS